MDCIELEGKVVKLSLVTHADKLRKLQAVLSKNRHKADLFLPDEVFYGERVSADDPERMADVLFRWLGVKHRSVHFTINTDQTELIRYKHTKNTSQVTLGASCLTDELLCGAAVAHAVVHHLLLARAKISLGHHEEDESLTDLGTIYAGFGLIILNSFESEAVLGSMGTQNYASEFLDYCSDERIVANMWEPYVLPQVAKSFLTRDTKNVQVKSFITHRLRQRRSSRTKVLAVTASLLLALLIVTIASLSKPDQLSPEMHEKRDTIAVLKAEIEHCQETVKRKQSTWDQSDIFIQRQIDADKTRCTSLLNRYNYEVNEYNSKL